jgi:hypothetical protein
MRVDILQANTIISVMTAETQEEKWCVRGWNQIDVRTLTSKDL